MTSRGRHSVLGVLVDAVDYDEATERILCAARERRPYAVSALAVHGVMTGVLDPEHRYRLNHLDMVTPDGQAVRWSLDVLHRTHLPDRVYGPTLMMLVVEGAIAEGLPVYLYGSRPVVVEALAEKLRQRFPALIIAGAEASRFRPVSPEERAAIAERIQGSGARITFVGLGCPNQEIFAYEWREALGMPVVAVGAAFDYHSGSMAEPPVLLQRAGLQWLHRLLQEPRRLWRRYLLLNPAYLGLLAAQAARAWRPDTAGRVPEYEVRPG